MLGIHHTLYLDALELLKLSQNDFIGTSGRSVIHPTLYKWKKSHIKNTLTLVTDSVVRPVDGPGRVSRRVPQPRFPVATSSHSLLSLHGPWECFQWKRMS